MIDYSVFLRVAESVGAAVFGALALRLIERRPKVVVFYGHVGEFRLQPNGTSPGALVHTHSVVVRNSGKLIT